jgi:hypothetical protein
MPITTFETQTTPLTDKEKLIAEILLDKLRPTKRIAGTEFIIRYFANIYRIKLTPPKVRAMIHYLRTEHHAPIIGTSKGYHMAKNQAELNDQIKSLEQRARSIQFVADALKLITI